MELLRLLGKAGYTVKLLERSKIARQLILTLLSIQKTGRKIEGG
ncbi:putative resolvase/integrase [Clostridioides difficile DA00189]|nr:hypothetical protein [Clostridioides difficile]EQG99286.1 putative resolvase/integrase [Clostridioides difficile DA00189]